MSHFLEDYYLDDMYGDQPAPALQALIDQGVISRCPACNALNTTSLLHSNMSSDGTRILREDGFSDGGEAYTADEINEDWEDVYYAPGGYCAACLQTLDLQDRKDYNKETEA